MAATLGNRHQGSAVNAAPTAGVMWAIVGVMFLAYFFYVMIAWMTSPDFARTMPAEIVPDSVKLRMNILQGITCFITLLTVYFFVIKPKLQIPSSRCSCSRM